MDKSSVLDQLRYTSLLRAKRLARYFQRHALSLTIFCLSVSIFLIEPWAVSSHLSQASGFEKEQVAFQQERGLSFQLAFWEPKDPNHYVTALSQGMVRNPVSVSGMLAGDVHDLLKRPDLERREMGVVVWQYRTDRCVVDFFFDTGAPQSALQIDGLPVDYFEIRERRTVKLGQSAADIAPDFAEGKGQESCLSGLVASRSDDPSKIRKWAALVDDSRG